jgi:hypothetical protein
MAAHSQLLCQLVSLCRCLARLEVKLPVNKFVQAADISVDCTHGLMDLIPSGGLQCSLEKRGEHRCAWHAHRGFDHVAVVQLRAADRAVGFCLEVAVGARGTEEMAARRAICDALCGVGAQIAHKIRHGAGRGYV